MSATVANADPTVITLDNGIIVPRPPEAIGDDEGVLAKAIKATEAKSAEDKAAKILSEAASDPKLQAAEKAAARLNKANMRTVNDWLAIGEAMVRIDELVGGAKKLIGQIVAQFPEFAAIPSPIRSNAKWLFINRERVIPLVVAKTIKADHPTTIREKWKLLEEEARRDNAGNEEMPEPEGDEPEAGGSDPENDKAIEEAMGRLEAFVQSVGRQDLDAFVMRLGSLLAEKASTRKLLLSQLPKKD